LIKFAEAVSDDEIIRAQTRHGGFIHVCIGVTGGAVVFLWSYTFIACLIALTLVEVAVRSSVVLLAVAIFVDRVHVVNTCGKEVSWLVREETLGTFRS
jgi:hypothetical protein